MATSDDEKRKVIEAAAVLTAAIKSLADLDENAAKEVGRFGERCLGDVTIENIVGDSVERALMRAPTVQQWHLTRPVSMEGFESDEAKLDALAEEPGLITDEQIDAVLEVVGDNAEIAEKAIMKFATKQLIEKAGLKVLTEQVKAAAEKAAKKAVYKIGKKVSEKLLKLAGKVASKTAQKLLQKTGQKMAVMAARDSIPIIGPLLMALDAIWMGLMVGLDLSVSSFKPCNEGEFDFANLPGWLDGILRGVIGMLPIVNQLFEGLIDKLCMRTVSCEGDEESNGAGLCYPKCRDGFKSNRMTLCYRQYPEFENNGKLHTIPHVTKNTINMGVGSVPNVCGPNDEPYGGGGVCYEKCPAGQTKRALYNCYESPPVGYDWTTPGGYVYGKICPANTNDSGTTCWYNRPAGRIPDKRACEAGWRDDGTTCWFESYGRGVGRPAKRQECGAGERDDGTSCWKSGRIVRAVWNRPLTCNADEDLVGALCYPKCRAGYHAVGCCVCEPDGGIKTVQLKDRQYCGAGEVLVDGLCYQQPRAGFKCAGVVCDMSKDLRTATRLGGVGSSTPKCPAGKFMPDSSKGLCYDTCPTGYSMTTAGVCWQDCPAGSKDIGAACEREHYDRGVGKVSLRIRIKERKEKGPGLIDKALEALEKISEKIPTTAQVQSAVQTAAAQVQTTVSATVDKLANAGDEIKDAVNVVGKITEAVEKLAREVPEAFKSPELLGGVKEVIATAGEAFKNGTKGVLNDMQVKLERGLQQLEKGVDQLKDELVGKAKDLGERVQEVANTLRKITASLVAEMGRLAAFLEQLAKDIIGRLRSGLEGVKKKIQEIVNETIARVKMLMSELSLSINRMQDGMRNLVGMARAQGKEALDRLMAENMMGKIKDAMVDIQKGWAEVEQARRLAHDSCIAYNFLNVWTLPVALMPWLMVLPWYALTAPLATLYTKANKTRCSDYDWKVEERSRGVFESVKSMALKLYASAPASIVAFVGVYLVLVVVSERLVSGAAKSAHLLLAGMSALLTVNAVTNYPEVFDAANERLRPYLKDPKALQKAVLVAAVLLLVKDQVSRYIPI